MLTCPKWTAVKDHLRSVSFNDKGASLARLPTILERACSLRFVSIRAASLGTAEEPFLLQGGIAAVSKLYLSSRSLHVSIPSSVTWSSISLIECDQLGIRQANSPLLSPEMRMAEPH